MRKHVLLTAAALVSSLAVAGVARADEPPLPPPSGLSLGGHLGLAIPIFTIASSTTEIGNNFFSIGISSGVTLKLDPHWAFDFEMVAYNEFKATPSFTSFVVDPGVLYNFGPVVVGGRVATKLGGGQTTNIGVVPLVVLPFKVSRQISYFVEADVPIWFSDKETGATGLAGGATGVQPSVGLQFQTGIGF